MWRYGVLCSFLRRWLKVHVVLETFPIFAFVKAKKPQETTWHDAIVISVDRRATLAYGVVFDPSSYVGLEDLPVDSVNFPDAGVDPGRTHPDGLSLVVAGAAQRSLPGPVVMLTADGVQFADQEVQRAFSVGTACSELRRAGGAACR